MKKTDSGAFGYIFVGVLVALSFFADDWRERSEAPRCELCERPILQGVIDVEDYGSVCANCFFSNDFIYCPRCGDIRVGDPSMCLYGLCASCTDSVAYHCAYCGNYVVATDTFHIVRCPVCGKPPD